MSDNFCSKFDSCENKLLKYSSCLFSIFCCDFTRSVISSSSVLLSSPSSPIFSTSGSAATSTGVGSAAGASGVGVAPGSAGGAPSGAGGTSPPGGGISAGASCSVI